MLKVGVFGATGYAGREAVRLLSAHPRAKVAFTTGSGEGHLAHEAGLEQQADAYLLSLPHGISSTYAVRLRVAWPRAVVVDLSGDLRLPDAASYKEWYGHDHPAVSLLGAPGVRASSPTPAATPPACCCPWCRSCGRSWSTPTTS